MSSTMYNEIIKTLWNQVLSHFQCNISGIQREKTNPPREQPFEQSFLHCCGAQCPPQHIHHLPLHPLFLLFLFLLCSLPTAYLQQPSKNRAQGMAQTQGSSQHFILFRLCLLKGKPWRGQSPGKGIRCCRKRGRALEDREVSAK